MSNFFRLTCVEIIFLIRFLTDPRYIARSLTQERAGMCIEAEKKFIRVYIYIYIHDISIDDGFHTFAQRQSGSNKTCIEIVEICANKKKSVDGNLTTV